MDYQATKGVETFNDMLNETKTLDLEHDLLVLHSIRDGVPRIWGGFKSPSTTMCRELLLFGPELTTAKLADYGYIGSKFSEKTTSKKGYKTLLSIPAKEMTYMSKQHSRSIGHSDAARLVETLLGAVNLVHEDPAKNLKFAVEAVAKGFEGLAPVRKVRQQAQDAFQAMYRVDTGLTDSEIANGVQMDLLTLIGVKFVELPESPPGLESEFRVHLDW